MTACSMRDAMRALDLLPPEDLVSDGKIHRFPTNGRGRKDGWYVLFEDPPAGAFGDWKTGLNEKWSARHEDQLSPAEVRQMRERMARAVKMRQAEEDQDRAAAALEALALWEAMGLAPAEHPYLRRKGVQPHGIRLAPDGRLAVPVMDADGKIHSLEYIAPDGAKLFLAGGRKKGLFFLIGQPGPVLCVAEGFATGASVHEASGLPVAVAFDCRNLEPVALALRKAWPNSRLVFAADDDWRTDGNPGLRDARKAAVAVAGAVVVPVFGAERGEKDTDFNDLARLEGPAAVRACVERAAAELPAVEAPQDGGGAGPAWTDEEPPPPGDEWAPPELHGGRNGGGFTAGSKRARRAVPVSAPVIRAPETEPAFHLTDTGNAERLAREHGADLRFCHPWKLWLVWDGQRWAPDETGAVRQRAKHSVARLYLEAEQIIAKQRQAAQFIISPDSPKDGPVADADEVKKAEALLGWAKKSEARERRDAAISLAQSEPGIPVLPADLDDHDWLLNCPSGTVDLRTGGIREHRRSDMITRIAPVAFDPEAKAPLWEAFLWRIMGGETDFDRATRLTEFLQRAVGYSLTGDVGEQVLFFLHGTGANGKSVFLSTLMALLGDGYARPTPAGLLLEKRNEQHPTEIADLFGARVVAAIETDDGKKMAEALVKWLTGGDKLKARRMREDFWSFRPTHKLWLAANHKPRVKGTDHAIWRRIKLVPFDVTIPPAERDAKLPERLRAELPGILRWAVRGCLEWQRSGLRPPEDVNAATGKYREEQDVIAPFIAAHCVMHVAAKVPDKDLYAAYKRWAEGAGERPMSQRSLSALLAEKPGLEHRQATGGYFHWFGIGLASAGDMIV